MPALIKTIRILAAGGAVVLSPLAAMAQPQQAPYIAIPQPGPQPMPPIPTPQGGFEGCYGVNQDLYGPYRLNFCLTQYGGGNYQVTGGGLNCQGLLNWEYGSQGQANIALSYSQCGQGVTWSPDRMACVMQPSPYPYTQYPAPNPNIAIPTPLPLPVPVGTSLRCNYQPSVAGYQPISILADRIYY